MTNLVRNICPVCDNPDRKKIEQLLAQNAGISVLAVTYAVDEHALRKHRDHHMRGVAIRLGQDALTLLRELARNAEQSEIIMTWAMERAKYPIALGAIKQHRETLVAIAKITGADRQLDPRVVVPHWDKIKSIILKVAESHPEVGTDLIEAIGKVEEGQ